MADSQETVSGYRENFPSETQPYAGTIDEDSRNGHADFQECNVYDQFTRPISQVAVVPVPPSQSIRPKSSRGYRIRRQPPVPTTSPELQYASEEGFTRPLSGEGQKESGSSGPSESVTRPLTSRGRRQSEIVNVPSESSARPRSARGQRACGVLTFSSGPKYESMDPSRPRTGKGRRTSQQYGQSSSPFDVEAVEGVSRPMTGRGRRPSMEATLPHSSSPEMFDMTPRSQRSYSLQPGDQTDMLSKSPSPPKRPPSSQRPKSRYNNRAARSNSQDSGVFDSRDMAATPNNMFSRPGSSLSRYTPLPSISGRKSSVQEIEHGFDHMNLDGSSSGGTHMRTPHSSNTIIVPNDREDGHDFHHHHRREPIDSRCSNYGNDAPTESATPSEQAEVYKPLERSVDIPAEVPDGLDRILLAIKLPSGNRVQRGFHIDHKLSTVLNYAELTAKLDFSGCELVCDVPRMVYSDMDITIGASGLQNRTVLHIQVPDNH